jgi:dipeptidyl-peptidase-4
MRILSLLLLLCLAGSVGFAQLSWSKDGNSFLSMENGALTKTTLPAFTKEVLVKADQLTIPGNTGTGRFQRSLLSDDQQKILLYANAKRVYHNTFSSIWVYDRGAAKLSQAGKQFGEGQLLNAKFSPDGSKLAYVFDNNIYVENLATNQIQQLTKDGNELKRNGWFDYASSEELFCTDGLRWSPDSKHIAFWQMNLSKLKTFYMINNTDSNYSKPVGLLFPKVGEPIAEARIGVVSTDKKKMQWIAIPGDPANYYITRMEWLMDGSRLIIQQLNRAQNESNLLVSNTDFTAAKSIYKETDDAWIDLKDFWRGGGRD